MSKELEHKLDVVLKPLSAVVFSPTYNVAEAFKWEVHREGCALLFNHGDMLVKVDNWALVQEEGWQDSVYPVVDWDRVIRNYYYEADVQWEVDEIKGKGRAVLAYFKSVGKLLSGLPIGREKSMLEELLWKLDKQLSYQFHTELLEPQEAKSRTYEEDSGIRTKIF